MKGIKEAINWAEEQAQRGLDVYEINNRFSKTY